MTVMRDIDSPLAVALLEYALRDDGGASRDRTGDLYNAIVALSQLSYSPEKSGREC